MKTLTRFTLSICIFAVALIVPFQASAMGWEDVPDGYTYQDAYGCIHHVHTQEWTLFGIAWTSRTVDDLVACPE